MGFAGSFYGCGANMLKTFTLIGIRVVVGIAFFLLVVTAQAGGIVIDGVKISVGGLGGQAIVGSGRLATEERGIESFDELFVTLSADVRLTLGRTPRLTISGDDNLISRVKVSNVSGTLTVSFNGGYITEQPLLVTIESPSVDVVRLEGAGDVMLSGVNQDKLELVLDGSGDIRAKGRATSLRVLLRGSGTLELAELKTRSSHISLLGSGDIEVYASEVLDVVIEGSGDVVYSGNPDKVLSTIDGAGELLAE